MKTPDQLYKEYLAKIGADESKMHAHQRSEMKRAFMGGCAGLLILLGEMAHHHFTDQEVLEMEKSFTRLLKEYWGSETVKDELIRGTRVNWFGAN